MKNKRLSTRIGKWVTGIGIIILVTCFGVFSLISKKTEENLREELDYESNQLLKEHVELVFSLLEGYNNRVHAGEMTLEEAKKEAVDQVRELRYDGDNYFWADSKEGVCQVFYDKKKEGKSRTGLQDSHGNYFLKEILEKGIKPGGGYTTYYFPRKGQTKPVPKRAYSLYYKPFDWVIGTGVYIDDIDHRVEEQRTKILPVISFSFGILLLIILLVFGLALIAVRRLTQPLEEVTKEFRKLSEGDLSVQIKVEREDEIGQMAQAASIMVERLRGIIGNVVSISQRLAQASKELSSTATEISGGASEQASSTEEVSSSMEEMQANIDQNAQNAREAERIVSEAVQGMQRMSETSVQIVGSVEEITSRISIINDIAHRTNILALNAAVESARAGEHGKGFAVVAVEVRKLAENSRAAAEKIIGLAAETLSLNKEGAEQTKYMLPEIEKTEGFVREISAASTEQAGGVSQINSAVMQLSQVAQKSASASEELAASSEMLEKEAEQLEKQVRQFRF